MTAFLGKERVVQIEIRCVGNEDDIKYLSEEFVNEMLADKDKEIERLKSENQKLNKVELFRYEHGFEACSIVYLINGEIHLYSIPMYGGEEKEEYIDFIDLEDLIEKIKKFT